MIAFPAPHEAAAMSGALVSAVIPTYNRAHIVGQAIDSVLVQTYANVEVIVVDDGSTDNTPAFIAERYGHDARVRYFRKPNGGVSSARNVGLREAEGAFIGLLDSDDQWLPWKVAAQVAALRHSPDVGMVWTDMTAVDPQGGVIAERYLKTFYAAYRYYVETPLFGRGVALDEIAPELGGAVAGTLYQGHIYSQMVRGNLVHTSTVLLTRDRLARVGGFDESLGRSGEDFDFHLRTCREGAVAFLDLPSINYRCGADDQLVQLRLLMATNFLRTVEGAIARDRDRIALTQRQLDEVVAGALEWIGVTRLEEGDRSGARRDFARALSLQPTRWRSAARLAQSVLPRRLVGGALLVKKAILMSLAA